NLGTGTIEAAQITLVIPGCTRASLPAAMLAQPAPDDLFSGASSVSAYECDGELLGLTLHRYPPRLSVHQLFLSLHYVETPPGWDIIHQTDGVRAGREPSAPTWRVTEATNNKGDHVVSAIAMWIDGRPTASEIEARVSQALNAVRPSARAPVIAIVSGANRRAIDSFLVKISQLSAGVDRWITDQ
ncbi:MAG TPA: hypothetical protein VGR71_16375, partial [Nitrospira sp.]|nr:hypothetical protein [Nitrospira sp.]